MSRRWDDAAGREAVERLLEGRGAGDVLSFTDPACWTALDLAVRSFGRYLWNEYDPRATDRLRTRQETALCHPDGRVRESALAGTPEHPAFWYLVVVRCADWVEPVRLRARRLLAEHLRDEPERSLRALTPLVLRMGRREQGGWARDLWEETLRAVPHTARDLLHDTGDTATRRLAARVVLEAGLLDARELARYAAGEQDAALWRPWSDGALAAMAADGTDGTDGAEGTEGADDETIDILLGARAPLVRSAGVTALRRAGRAHEAATHLTDRSGLVRACARWLFSKGGGDPHARYLELCGDPTTVEPYAVAGLAECGRRADAALLRPLLGHPVAGVRAQAVGGLRLLESVSVETVLPLLDDPSSAVVREATRALLPYTRRLPADLLTERLSPQRPAHVRRAAFRLLRAQGGLVQLRAAVAVLTDADARLRRNAESAVQLRRWVDDVPARDAEADRLLRQCTHLFSDYVMTVLRGRIGLPK